jgi:GxxExxY protein
MQALREVAEAVMAEMGRGHSEAVYHAALLAGLAARGVPFRSEVCCPFMFAGRCVGSGRADIVLDGLVVEVKAQAVALLEARQQLARYAHALGALERCAFGAVLLVMDRAAGRARLQRVDAEGRVLSDTAGGRSARPLQRNAALMAFRRRYRIVPPGPEACGGVRLDRLVAHLERSLAAQIPQRTAREAAIAEFLCAHVSYRAERGGHTVCRPRDGGGIVPI